MVLVHGRCVAILTSLLSPFCIHSLLLLKPISSFVFVGHTSSLGFTSFLWSIECSSFLNILYNKSWASTEKLQWSRHAWSRGPLTPKLMAGWALLCSCLHFCHMYMWLLILQSQSANTPILGILASLKEMCLVKLCFLCWISKLF